jgi:hypothetical protein
MDNIVGNYLNTGYGFFPSSRTITVYGVYDAFNLETIKMITNNGNGSGNGYLLSAPCFS